MNDTDDSTSMTAIMLARGMQADEILAELSKQNVSTETAKSIIKKMEYENFNQLELRKSAQHTMLLGIFFIATGAIIVLMKEIYPPHHWFFLASALLAVWGIRMLIKGLMKIMSVK